MARSVELTNSKLPQEPDQAGYRHFGDGTAGPLVAARLQGYYSGGLTYVDIATDVNGNLLAALAAGSNIEIGTVDQGAAGASAWKIAGTVTATGSVTVSGSVGVTGGTVTATWSTAQPISGTVTATGSVTVSGSVAVTGGVIGTITNSVAVTGNVTTSFSAPQHVILDSGTLGTLTGSVTVASGTIGTITNSVAVTGNVTTSFSAPQHVIIDSGTLGTLTNSVPVTGTFWQATQPVSGTVTTSFSAPQHVIVDSETPPTLTKGTQGTTGFSVQDLKDAGRSQIMLSWEEMAGTAAIESTLTNFTLGSKAGSALSAATSYTVTSGKTLRIQSVTVYLKNTTGTVGELGRLRIRQAASGIANSSPVIFDQVLSFDVAGALTASDNTFIGMSVPIPDGLEVASTQQITFTWFTSANTCTVGMTIIGYEY